MIPRCVPSVNARVNHELKQPYLPRERILLVQLLRLEEAVDILLDGILEIILEDDIVPGSLLDLAPLQLLSRSPRTIITNRTKPASLFQKP